MEILVGKTAGFCGGVSFAVKKTEEDLDRYKSVYCLGELVHNKEVINKLENKGLRVINNLSEAKDKVIIRAHGVERYIYEEAKEKNIELLDYTCKKVLLIHNLVEDYAKRGFYIILIGESNHPEVIGTYSFCGNHKSKVNKIEDVDDVISNITNLRINKILVVAQTTFNTQKFEEITNYIRKKTDNSFELEINNTICNATMLRQNETIELSKKVELMIIIGGKNSSNTNKLYDIAKKYCTNAIVVETYKQIDRKFIEDFEKIGIIAGASTPKESIDEVISYIKK